MTASGSGACVRTSFAHKSGRFISLLIRLRGRAQSKSDFGFRVNEWEGSGLAIDVSFESSSDFD